MPNASVRRVGLGARTGPARQGRLANCEPVPIHRPSFTVAVFLVTRGVFPLPIFPICNEQYFPTDRVLTQFIASYWWLNVQPIRLCRQAIQLLPTSSRRRPATPQKTGFQAIVCLSISIVALERPLYGIAFGPDPSRRHS